MGLRKQRGKNDLAALGGMVEGNLVGKNGFARTGAALDQIGGPGNESAMGDGVETIDTAFQALECYHVNLPSE